MYIEGMGKTEHDTRTEIDTILQESFGLTACSPYQRLVITNILEGCGHYPTGHHHVPHDQLVILPTGAGKSLCFMVPGLMMDGITLIIYPLLSLMNDQYRRLDAAGVYTLILRGGQSERFRSQAFSEIVSIPSAFILTNPETLASERVQRQLLRLHIRHAVIDEAHIVSTWGTTFRPAYLTLGTILSRLGIRQITAFTATASPRIIEDIRHYLFQDRPLHIIRGNTDRPNIFYRVIPTICKDHDLQVLLSHRQIQRPVLVFCGRRDTTERLALTFRIRLRSAEVYCYHAEMDRSERETVEHWFQDSENGILFATIAFGMGIDKKNIRTVIHYDLSTSVEAFLQESGRAGRDGASALSIVLFTREESRRTAVSSYLRSFLTDTQQCRRRSLLASFGQEPDSCFGCDVCNGCTITTPDGMNEMMSLIRRYRLQLTIGDAAHILYGRSSSEMRAKQLTAMRGFGSLAGWELDDIVSSLQHLIEEQYIKVRKSRWYRDRLYIERKSLNMM